MQASHESCRLTSSQPKDPTRFPAGLDRRRLGPVSVLVHDQPAGHLKAGDAPPFRGAGAVRVSRVLLWTMAPVTSWCARQLHAPRKRERVTCIICIIRDRVLTIWCNAPGLNASTSGMHLPFAEASMSHKHREKRPQATGEQEDGQEEQEREAEDAASDQLSSSAADASTDYVQQPPSLAEEVCQRLWIGAARYLEGLSP